MVSQNYVILNQELDTNQNYEILKRITLNYDV